MSPTCCANWRRACTRRARHGSHACHLPLTPVELADAAGLSVVHVNRAVHALRRQGLVEPRSRALAALDWAGLKRAAVFDPAYLHPPAAAA